MDVRLDEPGTQQPAVKIDGIGQGAVEPADGSDPVPIDRYVAIDDLQIPVHGNDPGVFQHQEAFGSRFSIHNRYPRARLTATIGTGKKKVLTRPPD